MKRRRLVRVPWTIEEERRIEALVLGLGFVDVGTWLAWASAQMLSEQTERRDVERLRDLAEVVGRVYAVGYRDGRRGELMDAALLDLLTDTVTIHAYASQNAAGEATYSATATTLTAGPSGGNALVEYATEAVRFARLSDPVGKTVVQRANVYLDGRPVIGLRDKITLPDGTTPQILSIDGFSDQSGGYVTVVHC